MERVQFQQEQMLAELKDLVQKGLFTQKETKEIMKRRTAFETVLVRRVAKKADFLRYAAYEMGLEQLRRKRIHRLKLPPSPPSVSDYALVRRQFHIFERTLKKFKSDVALWIQYIHVAKREGAHALQGRITSRALQLHPNTPALYILAASQQLNHLAPSAARTLLQRGIRLNPESLELWREHVKMELGFIESMKKRWGAELASEGSGKGKAKESEVDLGMDEVEVVEEEVVEVEEDVEGEEARKEIVGGAIVKSVISSAVKAIPKVELFESLHKVITDYPSSPNLRRSLIAHLHDLLRSTLPEDPQAVKLFVTRFLTPELKGEAFIEALKHANEELLGVVSRQNNEGVFAIYAEFVEEWCRSDLDNDLRLYLVASLRSHIQRMDSTSPSLLGAHIRLTHTLCLHGALKTARKYTSKAPQSARVWLERLEIEKKHASRELMEKAWSEARAAISADNDGGDLLKVWLWGLGPLSGSESRKMHEKLLKESMRDSALRAVHELILMSYVTVMINPAARDDPASRLEAVRHMGRAYLPTARVWAKVFGLHMEGPGGTDNYQVLGEIYELWRREDGVEAATAWASWLMRGGYGKEAKDVVVRSRSWLGEDEKMKLEGRWSVILDGGTVG